MSWSRIWQSGGSCIVEGDGPFLRFRVVDGVVEIWEHRTPAPMPRPPQRIPDDFDPEQEAAPPKLSSLRPGDVLSYAIQAVTGKPAATCGPCAAHAREMNQKGWLWCLANRDTIIQWLVEGARRRRYDVDEGTARELLAVAVREIKQRRNGDGNGGQTS